MQFVLYIVILFVSFSGFSQEQKDVTPKARGSLMFKTNTYNFGKIETDEDYSYRFIFKNVSKADVKIVNVETTCNCSTPQWSEKAVEKRKHGEIEVVYSAKDLGEFAEYIYVYIDENKNPFQLEIVGEVIKSNNK